MILASTLAVAFSILDYATNSVNERIAGADPAVCLSRFADYPPSKGKLGFPRCLWEKPFPGNERFWLKDVDFSCASPWNDEGGPIRAGTLISKRHIIFARHLPLWRGCRILFVDRQGEVCPCRIEATKPVGKTDIVIGLLDYEVTPNIKPAKILPDDFQKHIGDGKGFPIITFNQNEEAVVTEVREFREYLNTDIAVPRPGWKGLGKRLVSGDSGNPAFLLIGKEPILLFCVLSGGLVGTGPSVFHFRREIQRTMDELCLGYKLEPFDFSKVSSK